MTRTLLLGATMFGAMPIAAQAQIATPPSPATNGDAPEAADAADGQGNDIIVTASKREATLQDTPIAVSVTTAQVIEQAQVRDLIDVQTLVPSLRVAQLQSSANTNFIIRGFGNGANNAGIEPSVGVFIDGVYRSRSAAQIGDLPNLQRIEVLRGPQSTLFGKNASAGIISVVTAAPSFDFGGSIEAGYGNFNAVQLRGDVTGPLTDSIAFSLAANYNRRNGYAQDLRVNSDVNDRDRWGTRAQILFEPSDVFKLRVIADYDRVNENCCIAANVVAGPTAAIINALAGGVGIAAQSPYSYQVYNNFLSENRIENYGGSAQADWELGALTLTSITAYRQV
ncbi:MAG: TonB-dependent receptor, partial [Sphingopyxis sp.]